MIIRVQRTAAQQAAIEAILSGDYSHICISAGLAWGKTHFAGDLGITYTATYPKTDNCVSGPLFPQLMNSNYIEFIKQLEHAGIRSRWDAKLNRLELSNRSTFKFQSMHVEVGHLKGPQFKLNMLDEADMISRAHYERQTDRSGRERGDYQPVIVVFANSVTKAHWIAEDYVGVHGKPPKNRHLLIQGSTYDNAENLRADYIRNLETRYPAGSIGRRRWMYGETGLPAENAVFPEFDAEVDAVSVHAMPQATQHASAIYIGEGNKPTAVLHAERTPNDILLIRGEWVGTRVGRKAIVDSAKAMLPKGGNTGLLISGKPEGTVEDLKRMGLHVVPTLFDPGNLEQVKMAIKALRDRLADNRVKVERYGTNDFAAPNLVHNIESWENKTDSSDDPQDINNESIMCLLHIVLMFDRPQAILKDDGTIFGSKRIDVRRKRGR